MSEPAEDVRALFSAQEIAELRRRSDGLGVLLVLSAWGVILGAMALFALWPNPLSFLIALVLIGGRQLGLAVLMHDAAHGILTQSRWLNEALGSWACGHPLATDMHAYRAYHLRHHAHTQGPQDPDLGLSAPFPKTRASLGRKILRDLTGRTFLKQRGAQIRHAFGPAGAPLSTRLAHGWTRLGGFAVTNGLLLAGLAAVGHAELYLLLWLLPMATVYQLVLRIRNIAEHAMTGPAGDPLRHARTTHAGLLMRATLAPYWVNYHVEHHMFMWVPCYRLPRLHAMLGEKGLHPRMEIAPSYLAVLQAASSRPALAAA